MLQMADIIESEQDYIKFAEIHDDLGWDNFVEGRISKSCSHSNAISIHPYTPTSNSVGPAD